MRPVTRVQAERSTATRPPSSEAPAEAEDCSLRSAPARVEVPVPEQVPVRERPQGPALARVVLLRWPAELPPLAREQAALSHRYSRLVVVYGDCGTAGSLDPVLQRHGAVRLRGPHCYEMFAGEDFDRIAAEEGALSELDDAVGGAGAGLVEQGGGGLGKPSTQQVVCPFSYRKARIR